jgi:hypothetical protein
MAGRKKIIGYSKSRISLSVRELCNTFFAVLTCIRSSLAHRNGFVYGQQEESVTKIASAIKTALAGHSYDRCVLLTKSRRPPANQA